MKKHDWVRIFIALALAVSVLAVPVLAMADVGNFASDSDWGDSDWGGSDWGSSDWGDSGWDSGMDGFILGSLLSGRPSWIIIAVVIVFYILRLRKKSGKKADVPPVQTQVPPVRSRDLTEDLAELKKRDPAFSEEAFLEKVRNGYLQLQDAWEKKKWEPIRPLMTDVLFNQTKRQLDEYIENGQTNHMDRIAVLSAAISDVRQDDTNDIVVVRLSTRLVDYVTDDKTGELIRGSKSKELFLTYDWTMIRSKSAATQQVQGEHASHCPSCGAPISLNQSGQCEYCGTVLTSGVYDWVLSDIKGISQRS